MLTYYNVSLQLIRPCSYYAGGHDLKTQFLLQSHSQGFSLEGGRGGKRPWHRLVTCPAYTLTLCGWKTFDAFSE